MRAALEQDAAARVAQSVTSELHHRFETLTPREREVLAAIAAGRLNKQIAGDLGIVEQTVKFHRARIMERMHARTVAELMHLAAQLGVGWRHADMTQLGLLARDPDGKRRAVGVACDRAPALYPKG